MINLNCASGAATAYECAMRSTAGMRVFGCLREAERGGLKWTIGGDDETRTTSRGPSLTVAARCTSACCDQAATVEQSPMVGGTRGKEPFDQPRRHQPGLYPQGDGSRPISWRPACSKDSVRIEAYGTVDELNSFLGAALTVNQLAVAEPLCPVGDPPACSTAL
jgi:hypothetical protein